MSRSRNRCMWSCGKSGSEISGNGKRETGNGRSKAGSPRCTGRLRRNRSRSSPICTPHRRTVSRFPFPVPRCRGGLCSRCSPSFPPTRPAGRRRARCSRHRDSPCCAPRKGGVMPASSAGTSAAATGTWIGCTSRCTRTGCTGSPISAPARTSRAISSGIARRSRTTHPGSTGSHSHPATPPARCSTCRASGLGPAAATGM